LKNYRFGTKFAFKNGASELETNVSERALLLVSFDHKPLLQTLLVDVLQRAGASAWRDEFFMRLPLGLETEFTQIFCADICLDWPWIWLCFYILKAKN
jgi:hypothetical protein